MTVRASVFFVGAATCESLGFTDAGLVLLFLCFADAAECIMDAFTAPKKNPPTKGKP